MSRLNLNLFEKTFVHLAYLLATHIVNYVLRKIKQQFHSVARFPSVVGAKDGTLIPIKGISGDKEPNYVSRKNIMP